MEKFIFDPEIIWMLELIENDGRRIEDAETLVKYMEDQEVQELYEACVYILPKDYPHEFLIKGKKQAIVELLIKGYNPASYLKQRNQKIKDWLLEDYNSAL